jgi:Spy/CpxP family protein refolding chaperone
MRAVLTATLVILALLAGWIAVQFAARRYAARHPELGPAKEEGSGCCGSHCQNPGACEHRDERD